MDEFKGTPGPLIADGLHIRKEGKPGAIGQSFIMELNERLYGKQIGCPESFANAKLWAASHDLLKVVQDLLNSSYVTIRSDDLKNKARTAINKALGQ